MGKKSFSSGIDIVYIKRIKELAKDPRFLKRIFTGEELDYSFNKRLPFRHLAGRFAAKEACMKTIATGLSKGVGWKDIEVVSQEGGQPELKLTSSAERFLGRRKAFLSIAYSKEHAVAAVIIG